MLKVTNCSEELMNKIKMRCHMLLIEYEENKNDIIIMTDDVEWITSITKDQVGATVYRARTKEEKAKSAKALAISGLKIWAVATAIVLIKSVQKPAEKEFSEKSKQMFNIGRNYVNEKRDA